MSTAESRPASEALPRAIVVMGVSGSGKTSLGTRLAQRLGYAFVDGDGIHPTRNVAKMSAGIALTDADRWPWLDRIGSILSERGNLGTGVVVACSALRRVYRERLRAAVAGPVAFVFLDTPRDLLEARMRARKGHFMPASLLQSQLDSLESPAAEVGVVTVENALPLARVTEQAMRGLERLGLEAPDSESS